MEIKDRIKALEKKIQNNKDVPQELIDQLKELKEELEIQDDPDDPSDKLTKEIEDLKKELTDLKSQKERDYTDDLLDRYGVGKDEKAGAVCKDGLTFSRR